MIYVRLRFECNDNSFSSIISVDLLSNIRLRDYFTHYDNFDGKGLKVTYNDSLDSK